MLRQERQQDFCRATKQIVHLTQFDQDYNTILPWRSRQFLQSELLVIGSSPVTVLRGGVAQLVEQ